MKSLRILSNQSKLRKSVIARPFILHSVDTDVFVTKMSHDRAKKKNAQDSQRWLNVEFHFFFQWQGTKVFLTRKNNVGKGFICVFRLPRLFRFQI